MSSAIDAAGRLVIPKAVRDAAGITPETRLEVRYRDGRIEIEPAPLEVEIVDVEGVAVARSKTPVPVMSAADVAHTLGQVRDERG